MMKLKIFHSNIIIKQLSVKTAFKKTFSYDTNIRL